MDGQAIHASVRGPGTKRIARSAQGLCVLAFLALLSACHGPEGEPESEMMVPKGSIPRADAGHEVPVEVARLEPAPEPAPGQVHDACNLEALAPVDGGDGFVARVGATVITRGWFGNANGTEPAATPVLTILAQEDDVGWRVALTRGVERPDVALALQSEGMSASGFSQVFALDGLAPGEYRLLLVDETAPEEVACDNGRTLTVLP